MTEGLCEMSNLEDYLHRSYSFNAMNADGQKYPVLQDFNAERTDGEQLLNENNEVLVNYLQPNETFNVKLYYELVTMCTEW